jgi:hypothetical protein
MVNFGAGINSTPEDSLGSLRTVARHMVTPAHDSGILNLEKLRSLPLWRIFLPPVAL